MAFRVSIWALLEWLFNVVFPFACTHGKKCCCFYGNAPLEKLWCCYSAAFCTAPIFILPAKRYTKWNIAINAHEISQSAAWLLFAFCLSLSCWLCKFCLPTLNWNETHALCGFVHQPRRKYARTRINKQIWIPGSARQHVWPLPEHTNTCTAYFFSLILSRWVA